MLPTEREEAITYIANRFLHHHNVYVAKKTILSARFTASYLQDLKKLLNLDPMGPPHYLPAPVGSGAPVVAMGSVVAMS
jgi:hypothetical protein